MNDTRFTVEDRADESRYVLLDRGEASDAGAGAGAITDTGGATEIGEEAYVDLQGGSRTERIMFHTLVDEAYGGQGLASVLVRFAVEHTIASGFAVVPVCPYVVTWVKKHPEYAEHIVKAGPQHLQAVSSAQG